MFTCFRVLPKPCSLIFRGFKLHVSLRAQCRSRSGGCMAWSQNCCPLHKINVIVVICRMHVSDFTLPHFKFGMVQADFTFIVPSLLPLRFLADLFQSCLVTLNKWWDLCTAGMPQAIDFAAVSKLHSLHAGRKLQRVSYKVRNSSSTAPLTRMTCGRSKVFYNDIEDSKFPSARFASRLWSPSNESWQSFLTIPVAIPFLRGDPNGTYDHYDIMALRW